MFCKLKGEAVPVIEITDENPPRGIIIFSPEELLKIVSVGEGEVLMFNHIWTLIKEIFNIPDDDGVENFFIRKMLQREDAFFLIPIESLQYYLNLLKEYHIPLRYVH